MTRARRRADSQRSRRRSYLAYVVIAGIGLIIGAPVARKWAAFKFLHVGMMGMRRERDYVFRRDGTFDLYKSNIVAGRTFAGPDIGVSGPGFAYSGGPNASLVVVGRPNEQRLRCRIDGYVLELTAGDGTVERHFIARFGDDKADDPASLHIGGEMLWDRDRKDKPTKKK